MNKKIREGDIIMVIKDSRPMFLTVEEIGKNNKGHTEVWTEETPGYFNITECYPKEWVDEQFKRVKE